MSEVSSGRSRHAAAAALGLLLSLAALAGGACGGPDANTGQAGNTNNENAAAEKAAAEKAAAESAAARKYEEEQRRLADYIAGFKAQSLPPRVRSGGAYIRGKALILKKEADQRIGGEVVKGDVVLERCYSIPEDRCTETPGEHSTVIYIKVSNRRIGRYSNGATAYDTLWHVSIIDTTIPGVVASKTFEDYAPEEISDDGTDADTPYYAPGPTYEFQEYVESLPVR